MKYSDYKTLYAAALERLCEEQPEAELDDLKGEAEEQVKQQMAKAANNNDNKQTDRR